MGKYGFATILPSIGQGIASCVSALRGKTSGLGSASTTSSEIAFRRLRGEVAKAGLIEVRRIYPLILICALN
jgi:hypothetical protein